MEKTSQSGDKARPEGSVGNHFSGHIPSCQGAESLVPSLGGWWREIHRYRSTDSSTLPPSLFQAVLVSRCCLLSCFFPQSLFVVFLATSRVVSMWQHIHKSCVVAEKMLPAGSKAEHWTRERGQQYLPFSLL